MKNEAIFPRGFELEEVREGHLVSLRMKKLWMKEIEIFFLIQRICKTYNIQFFAYGGTLLGAIRHHGMIPWDDDIDICMLREDYNKFLQVAVNELEPPFMLQTERTDPGCLTGFARVRNSETTCFPSSQLHRCRRANQGVFVDIFCLDSVYDDQTKTSRMLKKALKAKIRSAQFDDLTVNFVKGDEPIKLKTLFHHLWCTLQCKTHNGVNPYFLRFEKYVQSCKQKNPQYVCDFEVAEGNVKKIQKSAWFSNSANVPFEFFEIPVPVGAESILDNAYGDWHKYVKGATTHSKLIFDTDTPYTLLMAKLREEDGR